MLKIKGINKEADKLVISFTNGESCEVSGEDFRILTDIFKELNMPKVCTPDPSFLAQIKQKKKSSIPNPTVKLIHPFER